MCRPEGEAEVCRPGNHWRPASPGKKMQSESLAESWVDGAESWNFGNIKDFQGKESSSAPNYCLNSGAMCWSSSSQPAEAETKAQSMSHQSDTLHLPCGQMRGQGLGSQGTCTQPMEMMHLQQTIEKHIMQLATRHQQQDLVLGDQRHHQATGEQEALLGNLMSQLVNLLQSGAPGGLGLQPSYPPLDVRGDVGGGQGAQSAGQPDQPVHQLKDPEATFVSQHLSNRGI
ncbi:hypothetical protein GH733_007390 [Mirounga leonina]|nr:hypothetical protein GH733_007390 [Mirounga leonina]